VVVTGSAALNSRMAKLNQEELSEKMLLNRIHRIFARDRSHAGGGPQTKFNKSTQAFRHTYIHVVQKAKHLDKKVHCPSAPAQSFFRLLFHIDIVQYNVRKASRSTTEEEDYEYFFKYICLFRTRMPMLRRQFYCEGQYFYWAERLVF
jgi:hypothetical protein